MSRRRTPSHNCATYRCKRRPQRNSASGLCRTCHRERYEVSYADAGTGADDGHGDSHSTDQTVTSPDVLTHGEWVKRNGIQVWVPSN